LEARNELELRDLLRSKGTREQILKKLIQVLGEPHAPPHEKISIYYYLYNSGLRATLARVLVDAFNRNENLPFDLLLDITAAEDDEPPPAPVIEAVSKGLRKQKAFSQIVNIFSWDKWEKRIAEFRKQFLEVRHKESAQAKADLVEKFLFLRDQRMLDQARTTLKRLLVLYPTDPVLIAYKKEFEERHAREVLNSHMSNMEYDKFERTKTVTSEEDRKVLNCFLREGEKLALTRREAATDLALTFLFLEEYELALAILPWAPVNAANDWLKVELLIGARLFAQALDDLNQLEIKYHSDPETIFAVSYMRAQCFHGLGQSVPAIETLQSILNVRPSYRSSHALILEWKKGISRI
jgi:hypothetical protein